jgi:hypothetical protein
MLEVSLITVSPLMQLQLRYAAVHQDDADLVTLPFQGGDSD